MTRTDVALLTLGDPQRLTGGYLFHRRLADRAGANGARMAFVSIPAAPLPWAMASGPVWLAHPALRRADAVVVDSIAAAPAAPWLAAIRAPVLGMLHQLPGGMDGGPVGRVFRAPFDRWAYRRAALLMVASEWLRRELIDAGIAEHRITLVPPGKDMPVATTAAGGPLPNDLRAGRSIAALCVANWLPRKGLLELLDAVAALDGHLVTLHLVGDSGADPRYAERVRARLARPDLAGRVVVHGPVSSSTVARMYAAADAFVLPSLEEPYGTVWGEAMAAGLPVIGWHAANLPHLADDGVDALLAPARDIAALSKALDRIAREPALRRRIGESAARRAADRPTWDETAALFFETVRSVT